MAMTDDIPAGFWATMESTLGAEGRQALAPALGREPEVSIRLNRRKPGAENKWAECERVSWCNDGIYLAERPNFTLDPCMHQGMYYVQEAASMIYSEIVSRLTADGTPVRYLDVCAAPGGKSTAAAAVLPEGSLLVANEYVPQRANILVENLIKWGMPSVMATCAHTSKLGGLTAMFDIVAVDAPCSGEGMMRKEPEAVRQWSERLTQNCAALQSEILDNVWDALKPGGYLIYSTCTYNRTENEAQIEQFAQRHGAEGVDVLKDVLPPNAYGLSDKLPTYRFMPHITRSEGLFVAVIRKPDGSVSARRSKPRGKGMTKTSTGFICDVGFTEYKNGASIIALPDAHADVMAEVEQAVGSLIKGVKTAEVVAREEKPTHAVAMSWILDRSQFTEVELDTQMALSYLHRDVMQMPEGTPRGHILLTYAGQPLGWVKNLSNRANNLYPQEYRIRMDITRTDR